MEACHNIQVGATAAASETINRDIEIYKHDSKVFSRGKFIKMTTPFSPLCQKICVLFFFLSSFALIGEPVVIGASSIE